MLTIPELRNLLKRLDGESVDAIESETLECKSWDSRPEARAAQIRQVREAVVCLANAGGGIIVVGLLDSRRTRRDAIQNIKDLDRDGLRRQIYDGTAPPILVDVEELIEPEGRLLVIRVPRGMPPHTTSEGVGKIRIGKECKPLTGSELARLFFSGGARDFSAESFPGGPKEFLDEEHIGLLRRTIEAEGGNVVLSRLPTDELLQNLGLLRDGGVTSAAVLLLGRKEALASQIPQHEVIFLRFVSQTRYDVRHDLRGPLLETLRTVEGLLRAHAKIGTLETEGFGEILIPEFTWWAAREAILNALVHRDYFLRQSVQIELRPDRLEITSPGGFVGGVTPENILRHPPARRNVLLAETLHTAGVVNRVGMGVDRIYEELLRLGKPMPRYEADESYVRLILQTRTHAAFARFVAQETKAGKNLSLDDLILMRALADRGHLDRWGAAKQLQLPEQAAADRLASLRTRGYVTPQGRGAGTSYWLARDYSDLLRGRTETDRDLPIEDEAVRLRAQVVLAERGRLTNEDVRRMSGFTRRQARRLLQSMVKEGHARLLGRGRGAHYMPAKGNK